jgi:ABC-type branched-subunit amino acid transport system substrate-binding protein
MSLQSRSAIVRLGSGVVTIVLMSTVAGCGSAAHKAASTASSDVPGVTAMTITIGNISSLSGPFGSLYTPRSNAMMAAIEAQNAKGGVYGRKIKVVTEDDQTSPSANLTAAKSLVESQGVFLVAENTNAAASSASYLAAKGITAFQTGNVPSLGSLPNFFVGDGAINPDPSVTATTTGLIFKMIGTTKVGGLAQSIATAGRQAAAEGIASAKAAGLQAGYLNTTLPGTIVDWTPYVLGVKNSGTDGVYPALSPTDSVAFLTAAAQQGVHPKVLLFSGYDFELLENPATERVMQGAYVLSPFTPSEFNTPGTQEEAAALKTYGHFPNPPDFVTTNGYAVGLLVIRACQAAGPNPTRAGLIKSMRAVTDYTANGLLPAPVNFTNALNPAFQPPNQLAYGNCVYVLKVEGKEFTPISDKPICGTLIKS